MKKFTTFLLALPVSLFSFGQNRALHFDGVNDHVRIPEKAGVLSGLAMTVEAWVMPTAGISNYTTLLSNGNIWMFLGPNTTTPYLEVDLNRNGSGTSLYYVLPASWTNQWHHVAFTYDGTTAQLFADGVLVNSVFYTETILPAGQMTYLGVADNFVNFPLTGAMDELRIWTVARTQAELQASINRELAASTPGLAACYRFNQGTAAGNNTALTTLTDAVAANDGSLRNFAKNGTTSNFVDGYGALVALAVKEGSFTATKRGTAVQLDWVGTPATNAVTYSIERSSNGADFLKIGTVNGSANQTATAYSFTDASPLPAGNYYRVQSIDASGAVSYSKTVLLSINKILAGLTIFPNPAAAAVQVQVTTPKGMVIIEVKDVSGRTHLVKQLVSNGSTLSTNIDVSRLAKGLYVIGAAGEWKVFNKQ
ncbi:MAG: T9SS type A sorting domain-containing protein [Chitinophagaceae bacterium]|nr:MAG: T9SS type A sorting domain-containing protein [Chitinophagaceae bacterium]